MIQISLEYCGWKAAAALTNVADSSVMLCGMCADVASLEFRDGSVQGPIVNVANMQFVLCQPSSNVNSVTRNLKHQCVIY